MTEFNYIDKKNTIINYIKEKGYLYYFLKNFAKVNNGNIYNLKNLWIEITKTEYKKNWIVEEGELCFKINHEIFYNISKLTFNKIQEEIQDFFELFSKQYSISLNYKNIQNYINITKEEYKNAWIIDRTKNIVFFKFRNLCGEGAMKKTYLGWNITSNKPIVVYQINVPSNQIEQKRYLNEKKIGELIKSPYLLQIYYSFAQREYEKVFMISDYIKYSIKNLNDQNYKWTAEELKIYSQQILLGLKYLHELNIIHRDIKPGNILYDRDNKNFKIIDFGIATKFNISSNCIETINYYKCNNEELSLVGTVGYIAPDMYKSIYNYNHKVKYDNKVDIFSFGVLLLEMVTNQRAFAMDLESLSEHIEMDLDNIKNNLNITLMDDYKYLKNVTNKIERDNNKKYEKVKIEIQEKMEIIHQFNECDIEEKNILIGELNDKNKSIIICCKKLTNEPQFSILDKKTNEEHSLILQLKDLENFKMKIKQFEKKTIDEKINDLLIYPILFNSTTYEYPKLLEMIHDKLLKDFLKKCLHKDQTKRSSINELLNHEYLK